jgi:hypothetical protein
VPTSEPDRRSVYHHARVVRNEATRLSEKGREGVNGKKTE